jgi:hypothetical protein
MIFVMSKKRVERRGLREEGRGKREGKGRWLI